MSTCINSHNNTRFTRRNSNDLGSQNGLLVSLDLYKEMIRPYHKRLFEFLKSKGRQKVYIFFHNDEAMWETLQEYGIYT